MVVQFHFAKAPFTVLPIDEVRSMLHDDTLKAVRCLRRICELHEDETNDVSVTVAEKMQFHGFLLRAKMQLHLLPIYLASSWILALEATKLLGRDLLTHDHPNIWASYQSIR